jgi:hypothetical protein
MSFDWCRGLSFYPLAFILQPSAFPRSLPSTADAFLAVDKGSNIGPSVP